MGHLNQDQFVGAKVAVLTVSDTRTEANDTSGAFIAQRLQQHGHTLVYRSIVKDEPILIRMKVRELLEAGNCTFIILTGGTGLTGRDSTPEAIRPLITKSIPGFGELFRMLSFKEIGAATIQSRAEAGLCGHAVVFALPGSTNACTLAMDRIILPQIDNTQKPCNFRGVIPDLD